MQGINILGSTSTLYIYYEMSVHGGGVHYERKPICLKKIDKFLKCKHQDKHQEREREGYKEDSSSSIIPSTRKLKAKAETSRDRERYKEQSSSSWIGGK